MNDDEIWLPVVGYEGLYEVSSHGRIRSITKQVWQKSKYGKLMLNTFPGRIRKPGIGMGGYLHIPIYKNNKPKGTTVHRLVCEAFHRRPDNKTYVNHRDGNKLNNRADNLEWCTASENNKHAYDTGLKVEPRGEAAPTYKGRISVYRDGVFMEYLHGELDIQAKGYSSTIVYAICRGRPHKHRGCTFVRE